MSTATPKDPLSKSRKDRDRERKEKQVLVSERLKTIIRRLPPTLPEEVFWNSVVKWVASDVVTWKVFYPGKPGNRLNKEYIPSRAYIAFKTEEQVVQFSREYDGHTFKDKAGNETHAVVEFAPFQKVPSEKKKPDTKNATIEKDEDYISFVASLNAQTSTEPESLEALIAASQSPPQPTTTPLLEALKAEKEAARDKEAILRNHAHHQEAIILAQQRRREHAKKRAMPGLKASESTPAAKKDGKQAALRAVAASSPVTKPQAPITIAVRNAASGPKVKAKTILPQKIMQPPSRVSAQSAPPATAETIPPPPASVAQTPSSQGEEPPTIPTFSPPRRRPMVGLASRQFEAALSGAGVSASERRTRREGEPTGDKDKEVVGPASNPAIISTLVGTKSTPPSPKRDRGKHAKKKDSSLAEPNVAEGDSFTGQREVSATTDTRATPSRRPEPLSQPPGTGGRGGRRGRGRGRGGILQRGPQLGPDPSTRVG